MKPARLISVAKGELPADLILSNARVVNVFTGEIEGVEGKEGTRSLVSK